MRVAIKAFLLSCLILGPTLATCGAPRESAPGSAAHSDLAFTEFFRRTNGWTAGDGAISVPLSDGRVLWLFGDSHVDDLDRATGTMPCLFQVRNAGLLHHTNDVARAITFIGKGPGFRSWFKSSTNGNEWFWPVCGFQGGQTVFVYLAALRTTPAGGMWGFESTGQDYWAEIGFPDLEKITYTPLPDLKGSGFGQGFVTEGRFTYAFGGKKRGIESDVLVARFESNEPRGDWHFWDGRGWVADPTKAVPIARGASTSVHVCKVKDKFILTSSAFSVACDQGRDIFMATSSRPTGPFSPLKKIFTVEDPFQGHHPFFYLSMAHPEFINEANEMLVTYSINGYEPCFPACVNGRAIPDHYRPKAIRVPLQLIDAGMQAAPER